MTNEKKAPPQAAKPGGTIIQFNKYFKPKRGNPQLQKRNSAGELLSALETVEAQNEAMERALLCKALRK